VARHRRKEARHYSAAARQGAGHAAPGGARCRAAACPRPAQP
jgi:hypothetical protein